MAAPTSIPFWPMEIPDAAQLMLSGHRSPCPRSRALRLSVARTRPPPAASRPPPPARDTRRGTADGCAIGTRSTRSTISCLRLSVARTRPPSSTRTACPPPQRRGAYPKVTSQGLQTLGAAQQQLHRISLELFVIIRLAMSSLLAPSYLPLPVRQNRVTPNQAPRVLVRVLVSPAGGGESAPADLGVEFWRMDCGPRNCSPPGPSATMSR
jgi:hypothetical protein